jgi:hypothetical protein
LSFSLALDYLKIGDFVTLKTPKFDGFMFADGILQESFCVEGASQIHAFEEALFCVHYPRQYSAARELEEFNEANLAGDHDALDEEITKKYSTALKVISESQTFLLTTLSQRGRDNENRLNDTYMAQQKGTPVVFGGLVQVRSLLVSSLDPFSTHLSLSCST